MTTLRQQLVAVSLTLVLKSEANEENWKEESQLSRKNKYQQYIMKQIVTDKI